MLTRGEKGSRVGVMKLKSISGLTFYVSNLNKTLKFYQDLGFTKVSSDDKTAALRLNWFILDFVSSKKEEKKEFKKEANAKIKGAGLYITIGVEDVDAIYKEVIRKGYKPSSEPRDWPWGAREFALRDPDGYKLIFSQKIK